jgi:hypothetical protein
MINIFSDNVNSYAMRFKKSTVNYPTDFLEYTPPPDALARIIHFISNPTNRLLFEHAVYDAPLEEMPLLINANDKRDLIVRWRMKIGK